MAMVNMNNLLNGKDSRWLQLEVCREFQRNKCSRPDTECKFAHPPANVEVQNGRVTACYDSIKGRCNREKPPCKYFHPPQHLKDQLLINGRNHLALKNAIMQQMGLTPGQPLVPGQVPTVAANPYLTGMPQVGSTYSPYFAPGPIMPAIMGPDPGVASPLGVVPQTVVQQKMPRSDRLEMDVKSVGSFYYENFAFPGMVPYKRPAADKSGMPVYQPSATTYQQLMQLQQPFVPVSCEYTSPPPPASVSTLALPPASASSPSLSSSAAAEPAKALTQSTASISQSSQDQHSADDALLPDHHHLHHAHHSVAATAVTSATVTQVSAGPDPAAAALAKEVAQQNYAKAVKLAAVSNSYGINPLTALSYTGVALNKHALSMPPPNAAAMQRYQPGLPFNFGLGLAANPYSQQVQAQAQAQAHAAQAQAAQVHAAQAHAAAAHAAAAHAVAASQQQSNLLAFSRPPPSMMNPYTAALLRPYGAAGQPSAAAGQQMLSQGLLAAAAAGQYPMAATPTAVAMPSTTVSQNNNNVVLQPYKKMKTT